MSSFGGLDRFGSGPHQIVVDGVQIAKKRTSYCGANGVDSLILGSRGRRVRITGQLKAATRLDVVKLISLIEGDCLIGPCDLVDTGGITWTNVELDNIQIIGPYKYTSLGVFVEYVVTGFQLI